MAHYGVQGVVAGTLLGRSDLPWILLGCVIPDVPWILYRVLSTATSGSLAYDVRAYAIAQSSLFLCCLLAAAVAALTPRFTRVFLVLSVGALAHLLLDSLETKWGNGPSLFAPFSWDLFNLGLFWTESAISVVLTLCGAIWGVWAVLQLPVTRSFHAEPRRVAAAALLGAAWLLLPLALLDSVEAADSHYVRTLRQREHRPNHPVEFDRVRVVPDAQGETIISWSGERIRATGIRLDSPATVSMRALFLDPSRLEVSEYHVHWPWFRDGASYVGLLMLAVYWIRGFFGAPIAEPARSGAR